MLIIFSGKQYSGKDTAAKILMEAMPTFRRCAMGDIIKIEYAQQHGLTYEEIEANKANYRQGLIDLGNWGRNQSPDYWLDKIVAQQGDIVVTDVRIKHEYEVFKKADAIVVCNPKGIVGRGTMFEFGFMIAHSKRIIFTS